MPSTFDIVADIIVQSCHIPRDTITEDAHLLSDLGIDSLDLLDVVSAVDDAFGVCVPVEQWLHATHMNAIQAGRPFVMREFCANIDALIAALATRCLGVPSTSGCAERNSPRGAELLLDAIQITEHPDVIDQRIGKREERCAALPQRQRKVCDGCR